MTLDEFKDSVSGDTPPEGLSPVLLAMWHQAKGNWDEAHRIAQQQKSSDGDWVHAYLHRVEGDLSNASYWYRRAGQPVATQGLREEGDQLVTAFLNT